VQNRFEVSLGQRQRESTSEMPMVGSGMADKEPGGVPPTLQNVSGLLRLFNIECLHVLYSSASRVTSWEMWA